MTAPSGTRPANSSAFSFGVTETLWCSKATTRPPYASCSAVMVAFGRLPKAPCGVENVPCTSTSARPSPSVAQSAAANGSATDER